MIFNIYERGQQSKEITMPAKIKMTLAAVLAAFGLGAVAAGPASAEWFVGGSKLTTTTALATSAVMDTTATWEFPVPKIGVDCEGPYDLKLSLLPPNKVHGFIGWLHCRALPLGECSLSSSAAIESESLEGTVTKGPGSSEDRVTIAPSTKGLLATIAFAESGTCPLVGEEPVKGSVTLRLPKGQDEEGTQVVENLGSVENNSLEVSGQKAFITGGEALVKLASSSKWSFH
jgi:hypothetical protein